MSKQVEVLQDREPIMATRLVIGELIALDDGRVYAVLHVHPADPRYKGVPSLTLREYGFWRRPDPDEATR